MPAPQQPQREISSAPRCDKPVQGDGIMSYHCTLPQGHERETSDPADPQPCYTVESSRTARVWRNWSEREHERQQAAAEPAGTVIQCPTCSEPAMRVTDSGGRCENCGAVAEIQQDISAATFIGEPMLPDDGTVAMREQDTSERDADIIAAAKAVAPERLDDNCLGEHDPATNLRCVMRPAPPAGYDLVDPGPQPLRDEQLPDWVLVAEGSPNPTEEQVKLMAETRAMFTETLPPSDTGYRVVFDNDTTTVQAYSISEEVEALRGKINAGPLTYADGSPMTIPHDPQPGDRIPSPEEVAESITRANEPTKQREGDQVLPKAGVECVQDIVIAAMQESKRVGTERYGQPLMTFNGRKGLQDIVDEARDFFVYGTMLLREGEADRETLVRAVTNALDSTYGSDDLSRAVANIAVDTIMGWVTSQRAEVSVRTQVLREVREALTRGPHMTTSDGSFIGVEYVLDRLDDIEQAGESEAEAPVPMISPENLRFLLTMVEAEFPQDLPSVDAIAQWPEEIRYGVQEWATAVHLVASDNHDVTIPETPEVLR